MEIASLLISKGINVARQKTDILVQNLTNKDSEEYCYEDAVINTNTTAGIASVKISRILQRVDENLMERIRDHHARIGEMATNDQYYQKMERFFGEVGTKTSFAHTGSEMARAIQNFMNNTEANRVKTVDAISHHLSSVSDAYGLLQDVRNEVKVEIDTTVSEVNGFLQQVAYYNDVESASSSVLDNYTFKNARRFELHKMAEKLGLKTKEEGTSIRVMTDDERFTLVSKKDVATLTATIVGDSVQVTYDGFGQSVDMTDYLKESDRTGSLSSLMRLHDTYITGLQNNLDNYSETLRDNFNAIHNLGTSLVPRAEITGTPGFPGYTAQNVIDDATNGYTNIAITGAGTLRLASLDSSGVIQGYADIDLSGVTSLSDLISTINAQTGTTNVTASVTASGEFKLTASTGGVAMTSVAGSDLPTITGGTKTLGFSHYFGLNNLLSSSSHVPGTSVSGLSQLLSVRSDIAAAPTLLATGKLSTLATPPSSPNKAIHAGDKDVLGELYDLYTKTRITFAETAISPAKTLTLRDFTSDLIKGHIDVQKLNVNQLKYEKFNYEGLSKEAARISKGDENEASLSLMQNSQWYQSLASAFKIIARMDEETYKIL